MNNFRTVLVSGSLASKPAYQLISRPSPLRLASDASECLRITRLEAGTAEVLPWRGKLSPSPPSIHRRRTLVEKVSCTPLAVKIFQETRVRQNDLVAFVNRAGTWTVVAPVNGSKADIRRSGGFDTRTVTAPLERITVVRHAGSPGTAIEFVASVSISHRWFMHRSLPYGSIRFSPDCSEEELV